MGARTSLALLVKLYADSNQEQEYTMACNYQLPLAGLLLVAQIILCLVLVLVQAQNTNFSFSSFNSADSLMTIGDCNYSQPTSSYLLNANLYKSTGYSCGGLLYREQVRMKDPVPLSTPLASFNTTFTFQITTDPDYCQVQGNGDGLAFTFFRKTYFTNETAGGALCLLNETDNGNFSNHLFAVEFDTFPNNQFNDPSNNHIGVNVNSVNSTFYYNMCGTGRNCTYFCNGGSFTAWIDYDSVSQLLQVFFANSSVYSNDFLLTPKPTIPVIQNVLALPQEVLDEYMYVGFTGSTGAYGEIHQIQSWTFMSFLPEQPPSTRKVGIIVAICAGAVLVFLVLGFFIVRHKRGLLSYRRQEDCILVDPNLVLHMYRYKELSKATNNFNKSELLGRGGFGAIYKGTLPSGAVVAVKRMSFKHGKESFQAEVTSLSQIRHRNLVQLRGWCHHEEQLLLVYDYMCNGSLDEWLFHLSTPNEEGSITMDKYKVLPLTLRHSIMRGVAAALAYLHEECPQCVLHRDIKSSNVLLDGDWNAYLGDFGLARLIDHHKMEKTTIMAGTIGYMAPEMLHTGKATKESDVYSFGVLMLEVLCGTRALERNAVEGVLVDRAWRAHKARNLLEIADPRLETMLLFSDVQESESCREFELQEASLINPKACDDHVGESMLYTPGATMGNKTITNLLHLGLLCCNPNPEDRPSMRVVLQLLQLSEDMQMSLPPLPDHIPQVSQLPMLISVSMSSSSGVNSQDNTIQEVLQSAPSSISVLSTDVANKMQTSFGAPESSVFSGR